MSMARKARKLKLTIWWKKVKAIAIRNYKVSNHIKSCQIISNVTILLPKGVIAKELLEGRNLLKQRLWHKCFPVNFPKLLRTSFFRTTSRSSHRRCSIKKAFLKNFTKFLWKQLLHNLFFFCYRNSGVDVFLWILWILFKNIFFTKHLRTTAFDFRATTELIQLYMQGITCFSYPTHLRAFTW